METIQQCFDDILQGDKDKSRQAARRIRKLIYGSGKYKTIKKLIDTAPKTYAEITEDWRQENFVMAISAMYFLHDREAQPDFLFPWFIDELLQHEQGNIRYAAVRMLTHELGPLTVHLRHPDSPHVKGNAKQHEQSNDILFTLFITLNALSTELQELRFKRFKYIDSLPTGPYKSVQMVLANLEEDCGPDYVKQLVRRYHDTERAWQH